MRIALLFLALIVVAGPAAAQNYLGDTACAGCHANIPEVGFFDGYMRSGHPWKIFRVEGAEPAPDTWPHTPVPPLPVANQTQLVWSDIEYVIGNYYWKTRYVDRTGFIWTGAADESTQWNLATQGWVQYHPGETRPFNCGSCHTTGYDPAGNQHDLPGLVGTWAQDGVRCEACHGPASDHVAAPDPSLVPPPGGMDCAECHFRDAQFRMPWKGGFMRHHQQGEDLSHSPHKAFACTTCHNPHRSTVYEDGGLAVNCSSCHPGNMDNNSYLVRGMESVGCVDCHMPLMAKSAVAVNTYKGDVHGHLFRITTDPIAAADNVYEDGGNFYWNQDMNGDSFVTLDYACLGCHESLTIEAAAAVADSIHYKTVVPVKLAFFQIERRGTDAVLSWEVLEATDHAGFDVYRGASAQSRVKLNQTLLAGNKRYTFVDESAPGTGADYWLAERSRTGTTEWHGPVVLQPLATVAPAVILAPVWPNPFGASTTVSYSLTETRPVRVAVYDTNGRWVRTLANGIQGPGDFTATWDGSTDRGAAAASGVYIVRLESREEVMVQKIVYAR